MSEFPIGLGGAKGDQNSDNKSYCQVTRPTGESGHAHYLDHNDMQVVVEKGQTLFFDGPEKRFPELKNCNDWVKFGYGYYIGVPWSVGQLKGTYHVNQNTMLIDDQGNEH